MSDYFHTRDALIATGIPADMITDANSFGGWTAFVDDIGVAGPDDDGMYTMSNPGPGDTPVATIDPAEYVARHGAAADEDYEDEDEDENERPMTKIG